MAQKPALRQTSSAASTCRADFGPQPDDRIRSPSEAQDGVEETEVDVGEKDPDQPGHHPRYQGREVDQEAVGRHRRAPTRARSMADPQDDTPG